MGFSVTVSSVLKVAKVSFFTGTSLLFCGVSLLLESEMKKGIQLTKQSSFRQRAFSSSSIPKMGVLLLG